MSIEREIAETANAILESWDDWDAEAGSEAQHAQSDEAYKAVMLAHLRLALTNLLARL